MNKIKLSSVPRMCVLLQKNSASNHICSKYFRSVVSALCPCSASLIPPPAICIRSWGPLLQPVPGRHRGSVPGRHRGSVAIRDRTLGGDSRFPPSGGGRAGASCASLRIKIRADPGLMRSDGPARGARRIRGASALTREPNDLICGSKRPGPRPPGGRRDANPLRDASPMI